MVGAGLRSWVPGTDGSGFPLQHLPYGVVSPARGRPRPGVAIGAHVVDLDALARAGLLAGCATDPVALFAGDQLNPFLAAGPATWTAVRERLAELLVEDAGTRPPPHALLRRDAVDLHLPFAVADYVDFYSSLEHATNLGRMFRPDGDPLLPNWRHLPVGYHGRAGTVVVSGTPVRRPRGQRRPVAPGGRPSFGPSERLDIELELGFVTGPPSPLGDPVPIDRVGDHIFGILLVNDWSARDLQAWEYQPLGPFLGKSFATSVAGWVTPLAALEPFRVPPPPQDPQPLAYLRTDVPWALEIDLEVELTPHGGTPQVVSRTSFAGMYWTMAQQLAHATCNGASVRTGDLYASGTISGPRPGSEGSLIELTHNGAAPLDVGGVARTFLADGDTVVLRGGCGGDGRLRLTLGEVAGRVMPAV